MRSKFLLPVLIPAMVALTLQSCTDKTKINPASQGNALSSSKSIDAITVGQFATFTITNKEAGQVLEIGNYALYNDGKANLGANLGSGIGHNNQKWKVRNVGGGYYTVMNLGSGKLLEGRGDKQQVVQNQATGKDDQLWTVATLSNGTYKITNKINGLALSYPGAYLPGAPIGLAAYASDTKQGWLLTIIPNDCYRDDEATRFFQRTSGSSAFDGGSSVLLSTGQVLWLTNDTFYNQINAAGSFNCRTIFPYRNSSLIQPASKSWDPALTKNIMTPYGVETFRTTDNKNLLWPGAAIQVGSKVYVHNIEVPRNSLATVNQYLTVMSPGTSLTSIPKPVNLTIPGMSGQTAIIYSIGMAKPGDGFVYVYGAGGFLGASVYAARFAESNPAVWTFWNGTAWAATPVTATSARVGSGPINNNTVGFVRGKYVLIAMDYGFTCDASPRDVYVSTSTSPTGPFTNKKKVYTLPDLKQGHRPVFYNPTIHSEFDNGDNELLVNYCVNFYSKNDGKGGVCLVDCSNADGSKDPNDYRPKGIRIPFSLIGL
ncbi:MAG: RICIN domain-containing protein [Mucilaginibacter sp.]